MTPFSTQLWKIRLPFSPFLYYQKHSAPKLICLALVLMLWTNIALANKPYTDAVELEAFLDGVMTTLLEQYRIPGGVIAVVHDDRVLLA